MRVSLYLLAVFIPYANSVNERISAKAVVHLNRALKFDRYSEVVAKSAQNGVVEFLQEKRNSFVFITGTIRGLKPGKHGIHIYELGNLENGCDSLGGHYNPSNNRHGSLTFFKRHIGDLGNIIAGDDGRAHINIRTRRVPLRGKWSVIGRAFVVHEDEDDLGLGKDHQSLIDGNSGAKIGCGIIGIGSKNFIVEEKIKKPLPKQKVIAKALVHHEDLLKFQRIQNSGNNNLGIITFEQETEHPNVTIHGTIRGLTPGKHGFHIHILGDIEHGCAYVGEHYNPEKKFHGASWSLERHLGDLGNIVADNRGIAHIELQDSVIQLLGPHSIVGRTLVITTKEDDLGLTNHPNSSVNGNSGHHYACGVIGVASYQYPVSRESAAIDEKFKTLTVTDVDTSQNIIRKAKFSIFPNEPVLEKEEDSGLKTMFSKKPIPGAAASRKMVSTSFTLPSTVSTSTNTNSTLANSVTSPATKNFTLANIGLTKNT